MRYRWPQNSLMWSVSLGAVVLCCAFLAPDTHAETQVGAGDLPLQPTRLLEFSTSEGTWLSLDISPDGSRIVFDLLGDLYELPVNGGPAKPLTSGMPFDTQAVFSPDGNQIAFISDRSGAENLWLMKADGSELRQLTRREDNRILLSPEWAPDGTSLYASVYRADMNAYSIWRFDAVGEREAEEVVRTRDTPDQDRSTWLSAVDPAPSPDGRYLYFAGRDGPSLDDRVDEWTIRRLNLANGETTTLVSPPRSPRPDLSLGTYFRPVISPDGNHMVYGTRFDGQTGLRILHLASDKDRWLLFPIEHDQVQASHWQGILPRYTFSPDGRFLILERQGQISRLELETGRESQIPFAASVSMPLGPSLRQTIRQETGPVRARLIQTPEASPDGSWLAFSALTQVYLMQLDGASTPRRLTQGSLPEFNPSWSGDGKTLVYVSWTARDGGQVWLAPADRRGDPVQLTETEAFYTSPVFAPGGRSVLVLRSSHYDRMHSFMEFGSLRAAELVQINLADGAERVITQGQLGGKPGFTSKADTVYINTAKGLTAVNLVDGSQNPVLQVLGPGWYFSEGPAPVDDLKISPDGRWALAQIAQQLHLLEVPAGGAAEVNLTDPQVSFRKLTEVGADFFDWAEGGKSITWAVGSTWYRRPFESVELKPPGSAERDADSPRRPGSNTQSYEAVVELPRDRPSGSLLLSGATAITMDDSTDGGGTTAGVIAAADILVVDDLIEAIGPVGTLSVPEGTTVRDVKGKYIIPGMIDTHDHVAEVRRGLLDLETWAPAASLAFGVTTKFDPSTLTIDMLAYEDLIAAGLIIGARIHSTGPALFSFNEFRSRAEVVEVLKRYRDHYRIRNLKMYRTGNRRVRQWVAMAAAELGMMPTTEGALAMKLDLSQIIDGYSGQEHALPVAPLYKDVVHLVVESGVSYTATLTIGNGGPQGQDYFISKTDYVEDPVLNRFWPRYAIDIKLRQRTWRTLDDYFFPLVAESVARIDRAGGLIGMGSHGEAPGIGFHWEMQAHAMGGMTPAEILHAATLGGARTIGRDQDFGSLIAGKYADLVILDEDPLEDISNALSIAHVMKNGRLYDAQNLDEIWPRRRAGPQPWFWSDVPLPARQTDPEPDQKETQ
ncbi:MAG TPA: amidohydrolase family protein [Xanthomonadales bacterium]|nr:amidohydrolase family protein [Xanthomonadales bacterium]